MSDRKVHTFTLHKEEDKDIIEYLERNKITKNVKKALRLLIQKEIKEREIEFIDKEQLLNIISILSQNQNTDNNRLIAKNYEVAGPYKNETEEEIDYETKNEFEKIIKENNGMIGPINLNFLSK